MSSHSRSGNEYANAKVKETGKEFEFPKTDIAVTKLDSGSVNSSHLETRMEE